MITDHPSFVEYSGNDSTVVGYAIPYSYLIEASVKVYLDEVETAAFTILGAQVFTTVAQASTVKVKLVREAAMDQTLDLITGGDLPSDLTEQTFDKVMLHIRSLYDRVKGCLRLQVGETPAEIAPSADFEDKYLYFDGSTNPTARTKAQVAADVQAELNISSGAVAGKGVATCADATARALLAPEVTGQLLIQLDNNSVWIGTGLTAGNWVETSSFGNFYLINDIDDFRAWTLQSALVNAELLQDITCDDGTLITVPSGHTLCRFHNPTAKIDCNYLHEQISWVGSLDAANVGVAPLFWHAQPCFGEPPLDSNLDGDNDSGTQLDSSLGGHPLGLGTGTAGKEGYYASVQGDMGSRILQTSWFEDDRADADAWQWFQAAIDTCMRGSTSGVVKQVQGHKHSLTIEHPINWTLRRAHYEGAGRDQSHFEISEMASLPTGWPKAAFIVHSIHHQGSPGTSGFQRRIRHGSIRDNTTDRASAIFWAGGRPEEHGEVGDWDLYDVKGFAFDFGNANGFIVEKINAVSNGLSAADGKAQIFFRRRAGGGLLTIRNIWPNYEGGTMFHITGGVTHIDDIDTEGCNTLLYQEGIADDVIITNARHGNGGANFDNTMPALVFGFNAGYDTSTVITNFTQSNNDGTKPLIFDQVVTDKATNITTWEEEELAVLDPYVAGGAFHQYKELASFKRSIGWSPSYIGQANGDRVLNGIHIDNNRYFNYKIELF